MKLRWFIWKTFGSPDVAKIGQQGDFDGLLKIYSNTFLAWTAPKGLSSLIEDLHNQSIEALCQFPDSRGDSFVLRNIEFATEQGKPYNEAAIKAVARIGEQGIACLARHSYLKFREANTDYHKRLVTTLSDLARLNPMLIRNIAQILDDGKIESEGGTGLSLSWTSLETEFKTEGTSAGGATLNSIFLRAAVAEALGLMNIVNHDTRAYVVQVLIHTLDQNYHWHSNIPIAATKSLGLLKVSEAIVPLLRLYYYNRYEPSTAAIAFAAEDALWQISNGDLARLGNQTGGDSNAEEGYKWLHEAVEKSRNSKWVKSVS